MTRIEYTARIKAKIGLIFRISWWARQHLYLSSEYHLK